ncbi:MAG: alpha/beta fold hydrolase [Deltaproteobacteria bacterium]|nr:alpha/beta fold hydrolase [Deltaproteobacteria bacterium]TLN03985.1 MAG: alpha/beta fold hydrolase [bacterium]
MAVPMIDQLRELIVQAGGNVQTVRELEPDQAVAHNALDSFGFTAFIAAIEERFAIRVSDKSSVKLRSLNDFAQYVEAQHARPADAGTRAASSVAAEASGLTLDGAQLHYEVTGSGPPLLLLNGIGLDLSAWGPLAQALSDERQLVLLETRGSGLSGPPPEPCTTARLAADALALLDHLSLGPVDVLGFSLGGLVAQELALLAPNRIRSLVLAATAARLPGRTRRVIDAWRRLLLAGVDAEAFRREQFAWVFGAATLESDTLIEGALSTFADVPAPSARGFAAQADACLAHDTRELASRIAAPALVLAGEDDVLLPTAAAETLAGLLPRGRFERHPGGHAFLSESTRAVAASVLRFLDEQRKNESATGE